MDFYLRDVEEIYTSILMQNQGDRGHLRIPESDTFIKDISNTLGISKHRVNQFLQAMKFSHHIFIFNITRADTDRKIAPLDGLVVAEREILDVLLPLYENKLRQEYQNLKGQDKSADGILKELLPEMNIHNNTPLGKIVNVVSMLREYLHYLKEHPEEFQDESRQERIKSELETLGFLVFDESLNKHVVAEEYQKEDVISQEEIAQVKEDYEEDALSGSQFKTRINLTFEKALKIYGLPFILKHHLKNGQFSVLEKLIIQNRYFDLRDLQYIRNELRTTMKNFERNPTLAMRRSEVYSLDRILAKTIRRFSIN